MKPSQVIKSSLGRIQNRTKNALNRKENPPGKSSVENSAARLKQAKSANRAEISSSLKNSRNIDKPSSEINSDSPQINEYMKLISRFENKAKQDQVSDKDLKRLMQALEDKVLSMSPQQQNRLKMLEVFKDKGIKNFKHIKDILVEMYDNKADRDKFFELLKSPEFVTILLNEPDQLKGYTPIPGTTIAQNTGGETHVKPALQPTTPKKV